MKETQKTRIKKIEVRESTHTSTNVERFDRFGFCGASQDEWVETPSGDRTDSLEEAFEHIQSEFYRHEKEYGI